ncbi:hypothetical protein SSS_06422 [Sarcoptes scabiei]|uniref:Uncharacterized protein n=1 Tax=Sarcoptes scabiei TaxID=52283 RepID=A0A834V7Y6_SARSC|nr:hypothetical protein SSS_06422 [Sarcoptes scabiei]
MVLVQSKRRSRKKAIVEQDSSNEMMEPWKIEKLTLGSSASELEANRPELIELKRGNDTIKKAIEEIQQSAKHLEDSTSKSLKPSQSSALQSSKLPITLKDFNKKDFVESKSFDKSQMTTKSSQPKQLPLLATKPVILTEESKKLQPNSPYTKCFLMDKTSPLLVQNHIDPQNFKKENKTNSTWTSKTWKSHDFHPLENDEVMKKLDLKSTTESKSIESLKKTPTLTSVISKSTEIDPKINILETRGENLIKSNDPKSQS